MDLQFANPLIDPVRLDSFGWVFLKKYAQPVKRLCVF
jgi:hypothetical protein